MHVANVISRCSPGLSTLTLGTWCPIEEYILICQRVQTHPYNTIKNSTPVFQQEFMIPIFFESENRNPWSVRRGPYYRTSEHRTIIWNQNFLSSGCRWTDMDKLYGFLVDSGTLKNTPRKYLPVYIILRKISLIRMTDYYLIYILMNINRRRYKFLLLLY